MHKTYMGDSVSNLDLSLVQTESQDAALGSCFELLVSHQHGVAAKIGATSTEANCVLKAHA